MRVQPGRQLGSRPLWAPGPRLCRRPRRDRPGARRARVGQPARRGAAQAARTRRRGGPDRGHLRPDLSAAPVADLFAPLAAARPSLEAVAAPGRAAGAAPRGRPQDRAGRAIRVRREDEDVRVHAGRGRATIADWRGLDGLGGRPRRPRHAPPVRGAADHGGRRPARDGRPPRTGARSRRRDRSPTRSTWSRSSSLIRLPSDTRCRTRGSRSATSRASTRPTPPVRGVDCRSRSPCRTAGGATVAFFGRPHPRSSSRADPRRAARHGGRSAWASRRCWARTSSGGGTELQLRARAASPSCRRRRSRSSPRDAFLEATASKVGDDDGDDDRRRLARRPDRGERQRLPGDGSAALPVVVMDLPTLSLLRFEGSDAVEPPDEWWLSVDGRIDRRGRGGPARPADREPRGADARPAGTGRSRPTRSRSGSSARSAIGFVAAAVFAVVGFVVSAAVSARERVTEFALLRALGLSRGQLSAWLSLENAGLAAHQHRRPGPRSGSLLAWVVLPFVTVTQQAVAPVPPVEIVVPVDDHRPARRGRARVVARRDHDRRHRLAAAAGSGWRPSCGWARTDDAPVVGHRRPAPPPAAERGVVAFLFVLVAIDELPGGRQPAPASTGCRTTACATRSPTRPRSSATSSSRRVDRIARRHDRRSQASRPRGDELWERICRRRSSRSSATAATSSTARGSASRTRRTTRRS